MKKIVILSLVLLTGCENKKSEVEKAMRNYDRLLFTMQADSIADCFMSMGKLGGEGMTVLTGRDSIRRFLRTFDASSIRMISNQSTSESIQFKGDTAVQEGKYEQKAEVSGKAGVYTGKYFAKWLKDETGRWRLQSMYTVPDKK